MVTIKITSSNPDVAVVERRRKFSKLVFDGLLSLMAGVLVGLVVAWVAVGIWLVIRYTILRDF